MEGECGELEDTVRQGKGVGDRDIRQFSEQIDEVEAVSANVPLEHGMMLHLCFL